MLRGWHAIVRAEQRTQCIRFYDREERPLKVGTVQLADFIEKHFVVNATNNEPVTMGAEIINNALNKWHEGRAFCQRMNKLFVQADAAE